MISRATAATAAVVLLTLVHLAGVASSLDSTPAVWMWHDGCGWAGSILGVGGTLVAVSAFARGDHLRRAWALFAIASVLLLCGTALYSYWTHAAPGRKFIESPLIYPRMVVIAAANAAAVWAMVLMAATYQKSGLTAERTASSNVLWFCFTLAALALAARQFGADLNRMTSLPGTVAALTSMASTVGDMATIILVVPILRVAYLLRGGRLAWVWWVVGLAGAVWLVYDARQWIADLLPGNPAHHVELLRVLRTPGLALMGLAGFLQREALREPTAAPVAKAA